MRIVVIMTIVSFQLSVIHPRRVGAYCFVGVGDLTTGACEEVVGDNSVGQPCSTHGDCGVEVSTRSGVCELRNPCVDGSRFDLETDDGLPIPTRFALCSVLKPGVNGLIESLPGGDDALVPDGRGQRREVTDPLNRDTDMDTVADGIECTLGSSPTDPGDTGDAGDRDQDGLTDNLERSGWPVSHEPCGSCPRAVASNPNTPDTDLDGIPDYGERFMPCWDDITSVCSTDPTSDDTDGDGISDFDELSQAQVDILEGFNDFFVGYFIDGSQSQLFGTDALAVDSDGDNLTDDFELFEGWTVVLSDGRVRQVLSDPSLADSDSDGLRDDAERQAVTDPNSGDTDEDGRLDGKEVDGGANPLVPDKLVTVNVRRIVVDTIFDRSGTANANAELMWWFTVEAPTIGSTPFLITDVSNLPARVTPPSSGVGRWESGRCLISGTTARQAGSGPCLRTDDCLKRCLLRDSNFGKECNEDRECTNVLAG